MHPAGTRLLPLTAVVLVPGGHWAIWNWPGTLTAVLAGAGSVLAGLWLARGMTIVDARLMRSLLGPGRVSELERTRAIAVEDAAAALRRVERDLHDGAQVRLAAVAMNLGLAREKAGDDALRELLEAAQTGVSGALADLRRIARGIHPPVLDSGLADALASLAATSPIPAQVRADLPNRPSASIETMAYFCTAELLANAIKHSAAQEIAIILDSEGPDLLRVRVTDDGVGGARPSRGGGLDGLAQRAATVDGALLLSSPRGGPTTVTVELPMRIVGTGA
jgi:signal transduction histidine kinase